MGLDQDLDRYRGYIIDAINRIGVRESARKVGCTAGYISRIKNKRVTPSLRTLRRLAKALDVKI